MSMAEDNTLRINGRLSIPFSEIDISFIRSSGPGGQHVNKASTQAELTFDVAHAPSLSDADRNWLLSRLGSKLDSAGVLRITAQEFRSQLRNKQSALDKFQSLLAQALERPKPRKKTKPTKSSVETRLKRKKQASEKKRLRGRISDIG